MIWAAIIVVLVLGLLGLFEEGDLSDYEDEDLIDELHSRR